MQYGYSNIKEYEADLQQRAQDYQAAQVDGELILTWMGIVIPWVGRRLVVWGEWIQPLQRRANAQSTGQ